MEVEGLQIKFSASWSGAFHTSLSAISALKQDCPRCSLIIAEHQGRTCIVTLILVAYIHRCIFGRHTSSPGGQHPDWAYSNYHVY